MAESAPDTSVSPNHDEGYVHVVDRASTPAAAAAAAATSDGSPTLAAAVAGEVPAAPPPPSAARRRRRGDYPGPSGEYQRLDRKVEESLLTHMYKTRTFRAVLNMVLFVAGLVLVSALTTCVIWAKEVRNAEVGAYKACHAVHMESVVPPIARLYADSDTDARHRLDAMVGVHCTWMFEASVPTAGTLAHENAASVTECLQKWEMALTFEDNMKAGATLNSIHAWTSIPSNTRFEKWCTDEGLVREFKANYAAFETYNIITIPLALLLSGTVVTFFLIPLLPPFDLLSPEERHRSFI